MDFTRIVENFIVTLPAIITAIGGFIVTLRKLRENTVLTQNTAVAALEAKKVGIINAQKIDENTALTTDLAEASKTVNQRLDDMLKDKGV